MFNALEKVISWILVSSSDPQEVSLTMKGGLMAAVPAIMIAANLAHLNLGQDTLTALFDGLVSFVQAALLVISTGMTIYGASRKLWITVFQPKTV